MEAADVVIVVFYFLAVFFVGIFVSHRSKTSSLDGYFLANRKARWPLVGASLFSSNIGSGHFIGLAGSSAAGGIAVAAYEISAVFFIVMLGWLFMPVYLASRATTMPEYMRKRFGGQRIRVCLSVLALMLSVFTKVSADLYAGVIFMGQSFDWSTYWAEVFLLTTCTIFTVMGGLAAVLWTDFVQTILMVLGGLLLMIMSIEEVGGSIGQVFARYMTADANVTDPKLAHCGKVNPAALHMFRSASDNDFPWPGMTFGLVVSSFWYWCSDQVIVQRTLAAKNISNAKGGTVMCGYLKFLPLYMIVIPGMVARILYTDEVACVDRDTCERVCSVESGCSNIAYAKLVVRLMPRGLTGMMLAVILASLMTSLTSVFNSSSALFTIDIWPRLRKHPSDYELLLVGRVFVVVMALVCVAWLPVIREAHGTQLFLYIQSVTSYLCPPVCAVFLLAVFWGRTNEPGAFFGLVVGLVLGFIWFIVEFAFMPSACNSGIEDGYPFRLHFLHFGAILFVVVCLIVIGVSFSTKPIDQKHLHRMTYWTRNSLEIRVGLERKKDRLTDDDEAETAAVSEKSKDSEVASGVPENADEREIYEAREALKEEPKWRVLCDFNAVLLCFIAVVMYAYYG